MCNWFAIKSGLKRLHFYCYTHHDFQQTLWRFLNCASRQDLNRVLSLITRQTQGSCGALFLLAECYTLIINLYLLANSPIKSNNSNFESGVEAINMLCKFVYELLMSNLETKWCKIDVGGVWITFLIWLAPTLHILKCSHLSK